MAVKKLSSSCNIFVLLLDYEFMMTPFWTCIVQKILFHEFLSQLFRDDFPQS